MEASEKVVESYFRYVKNYFTIPNLRCRGQKEIDLIGMRESDGKVFRIHVEVSVTTSGAFKKINSKPYSEAKKKTRGGSASERVKIGYFGDGIDCCIPVPCHNYFFVIVPRKPVVFQGGY